MRNTHPSRVPLLTFVQTIILIRLVFFTTSNQIQAGMKNQSMLIFNREWEKKYNISNPTSHQITTELKQLCSNLLKHMFIRFEPTYIKVLLK